MKVPEEIAKILTAPEQLFEMAMGFQRSRIFLTAYELDIFTAMGDSALSPKDIAEKTGADLRACERLLNALCALGLAIKDEGLFSNTELGARFLVRGSDAYMGGFGHMANLYRTWGTLTDAVRAGTSVTDRSAGQRDGASLEAFIAAMHQRAIKSADAIVSKIDLSGVSRVLDVGGGSGVYAMAFARVKKDLSAVVFDLPDVTELTAEYVRAAGLQERIRTKSGNYLTDSFGDGYNLTFLSAVVHINSFEENNALVGRIYGALNPGGRIIIQDFVMNEDRTCPAAGAVFALNMLVNTARGDTYTESEIRSWLSSAGFTGIHRVDSGPATAMIIGMKPKK